MTQQILHISSSPFGEKSVTRELGQDLMKGLKAKYTTAKFIERDLNAAPLPHISAQHFGAMFTPVDQQSAADKALLAVIDETISEVMASDILVIEAPMWNFGIPSVLKAWVDHISQAGKTFKYTETGPIGLVPAGKKVIVISSRGGIYTSGAASAMDHQESYLKSVLGFLGLSDVEVIRAEGVNLGPDSAAKAKASAHEQIQALVQKAA